MPIGSVPVITLHSAAIVCPAVSASMPGGGIVKPLLPILPGVMPAGWYITRLWGIITPGTRPATARPLVGWSDVVMRWP